MKHKYNKLQERVNEVKDLQFRAVEEGDEKILEGYAALYGVRSKLLYNSFYEIIEERAFDDVLQRDDLDVVLNFNHDNKMVMARTTNGTLKLRSDETGLYFRATLPDTSYANDVYELVKRGDIFQNSFAFLPEKDGYRQETIEGNEVVTITKVAKLRDVSAVTFPAYAETNVEARDEEQTEEPVKVRLEVDEDQLNAILGMAKELTTLVEQAITPPEDAPEEPSEDEPVEEPVDEEEPMEEENRSQSINKKKKFLKLN